MKKGVVLIVDDMSTHLLLLQTILDEEGYDTIILEDSEKVIDTLNKNKVDVMLLDIMMPGMDGFKVLEEIAKEKKFSNLPVIIISAKTDSWSIKNAMDKGAFDYITKPINIQDVRNKVQSAFNELNA